MLLVDQIKILNDTEVEGSYFFTGEEWFFRGHFPEKPIVPGVILCEIMAQSSCGLLLGQETDQLPYLVGIHNTKFRKLVVPGIRVTACGRLTGIKGPFYFVSCQMYAGRFMCAEGELSFVIK